MKTSYEICHAAHPEGVKIYDTARIRRNFLIENVFVADEVNMVYSMYCRMIARGALSVNETLRHEAIDPLKAPHFTTYRDPGIFNTGGSGIVKDDDNIIYELDCKEALYPGSGNREITFSVKDTAHPAKFYFKSTTIHCIYPDKKTSKAGAVSVSQPSHNQQDDSNPCTPSLSIADGNDKAENGSCMERHACTRAQPPHGSLFLFWNPRRPCRMPFMSKVNETRHLWMKDNEAVFSPEWSLHNASAAHSYTFI